MIPPPHLPQVAFGTTDLELTHACYRVDSSWTPWEYARRRKSSCIAQGTRRYGALRGRDANRCSCGLATFSSSQ